MPAAVGGWEIILSAFKAYDVRGIYGKDITEELAYRLGYFLPVFLKTNKVLVGFDGRKSSPALFGALTDGITDSGADAVSIGMCTTPMVYYKTAEGGFGASVMITASHNPREYNGFKISGREAMPVGANSGLPEIEKLVETGKIVPQKEKGKIININIFDEYIAFLKEKIKFKNNIKIAVDCSGGAASLIAEKIFPKGTAIINNKIDPDFKCHEPNPLVEENCESLQELVLSEKADIGIIFDGDGDRCAVINEKGGVVPPDLSITLIGNELLKETGETVIYDIRTSDSVKEYLQEKGANPFMWKVGHAFAKLKMREKNAIFGGELAGHYYFRDFFYCDSAYLAAIHILNTVSGLYEKGISVSEYIKGVSRYYTSGEINFKIENKKGAISALKAEFLKENPIKIHDFDGIRLEFADFWVNIRSSNTEPYLRLVCEAHSKEKLRCVLEKAKSIIKKFE